LPPAHEPLFLNQVWNATVQTLALSILAIAIASVGGSILSFLAARNFAAPANLVGSRRLIGFSLFAFTRALLLVCRAIPASIWALILLFVMFPGILPGAAALGLYTLGVLGRLMAESAENLDDRPTRALESLGATGPQTFFYGTLPRALPHYVAYILYRWEVCARETVIVGVVGAAGLGRLMAEQLSNFNYPAVVTLLIAFVGLTLVVDLVSAAARRSLL
jgi:phosphonate transport system permease protein